MSDAVLGRDRLAPVTEQDSAQKVRTTEQRMAETPQHSIEALIDEAPIGRAQYRLFLVTILVFIVDGFDIQIMSYLAPAISQEWALSLRVRGLILSSGLAGLAVGYVLFPLLAVRIGPRTTVLLCLVGMAVMSLATALAGNTSTLVLLRFVTGIVLGGVFPNMIALATEYCPGRYRSSLVSITYVGIPIGFLLAGWAAWAVLPIFGWRGGFVLGGILPLLAALAVLVCCPESLYHLLRRSGQGDGRIRSALVRMLGNKAATTYELHRSGVFRLAEGKAAELFTSGRLVGTLALWLALASNAVVYYFVLSWMPSILIQIGTRQSDAIMAASLANFGGIAAAFVTGPLMDRFNDFRIVLIIFALGVLSCFLVGHMLSPQAIVIVPAALCLGFCVSAVHKGVSALTMGFYPAPLRSIGLGWTFAVGRLGAVAGPLFAGLLLAAGWQPSSLYFWMAGPMAVGGIAVWIMAKYYHGQHPA
jgi:AAHS family 4-hydroxybenzoate transporter-like MFS transporter